MNIAYTSMDNYAPYLGISLLSFLENNKNEDIHVYILSDGIGEKNCNILREIVESHGQHFHLIDVKSFEDYFEQRKVDHGGFGYVVMLRLLLASILPDQVEKLIHLDCDTIVASNISELWNLDVEPYYYRALPDFAMPQEHIQELGEKDLSVYYNAGVMLLNLKKWRDEDMQEKYIQSCLKHKTLKYADQDVLNCCCHGKIGDIPVKYNFAPNMYWYGAKYVKKIQPAYKDTSLECMKQTIKSPAIIHYMGDERPWFQGNHNKYSAYYYKYKKMSPWSDMPQVSGKTGYMQIYFLLNLITKICPGFRFVFFKCIGINKFKWFGKK